MVIPISINKTLFSIKLKKKKKDGGGGVWG